MFGKVFAAQFGLLLDLSKLGLANIRRSEAY